MGVVSDLFVKIIADTTGLDSGLTKGSNMLSTFSSGVSSVVGTTAKVFGASMAVLTTATVAGVGGAYKLAEAASDLSEAQNVVNATFGESGAEVNQWATTVAESAGIGTTSATQMVGTMGAMVKSMGVVPETAEEMAKGMVQLSGDMASFYNLDSADAFEKIRAGIAGETEPLKQLGINMSVANLEAFALSEGITTAYGSMDAAAQATLRYDYLMMATADAQGDFAETSDGLANSQRTLKLEMENLGTTIGSIFLPAATSAVQYVTGMVGDVNAILADGFQMEDIKAIGEVVATGLTDGIAVISEYMPAVIDTVVAMLSMLLSSIVTILPSIIPVLAEGVVSLFTGLVQAVTDNQTVLADTIMSVISSIATLVITLFPMILETGANILVQLLNGIVTNLPQIIPAITATITSMVTTITDNLPLILDAGIQILTAVLQGIASMIPTLITQSVDLITQMANTLLENLPAIIAAAIEILVALVTGLTQAIPQLIEMLPTIITTIVDTLLANLGTIIECAIQLLLALIQGLTEALPQLIDMLPDIIDTIITTLLDNLPLLVECAIELLGAIIEGLITAIPALIEATPQIIDAIVDAFTGYDWMSLGKNIIDGIKEGIKDAASGLADAAMEAAEGALDSVKGALGIASPSKVFKNEVGKNIMLGMADGITSMTGVVNSALANSVPTTVDVPAVTGNGNYISSATDAQIGASQSRTEGAPTYGDMYRAITDAMSKMVIKADPITLDGNAVTKQIVFRINKITTTRGESPLLA